MVRLVVSGALGRMGRRITELAKESVGFKVIGGVEAPSRVTTPTETASESAGFRIVGDLNQVKDDYDCIIEFTSPEATIEHVRIAEVSKKAMVIGTTGLSDEEKAVIKEASNTIPIVFSPNMSVGVNVLFGLIERAAKALGRDYSVSIREAHHVRKKDKPSGTAKLMRDIVKKNMGGKDAPIESLREDEIVGDHDITFEGSADTLKLSHSAKTRDIFALGALKAAGFAVRKNKGLFSMADVLESGEG